MTLLFDREEIELFYNLSEIENARDDFERVKDRDDLFLDLSRVYFDVGLDHAVNFFESIGIVFDGLSISNCGGLGECKGVLNFGREVYLSHIDIAPGCIETIADDLKMNTVLSLLDLSDNDDIDAEGFSLLMGALQTNTTLKHLYLSSCAIDLERCRTPYGGSLETLALSNNSCTAYPPIGDHSINRGITSNLLTIPTLKRLEIANCDIEPEKMISIIDCVAINTTLLHLVISHNPVTDEVYTHLADLFRTNTTLRKLEMNNTFQYNDDSVGHVKNGLLFNFALEKIALGNDLMHIRPLPDPLAEVAKTFNKNSKKRRSLLFDLILK